VRSVWSSQIILRPFAPRRCQRQTALLRRSLRIEVKVVSGFFKVANIGGRMSVRSVILALIVILAFACNDISPTPTAPAPTAPPTVQPAPSPQPMPAPIPSPEPAPSPAPTPAPSPNPVPAPSPSAAPTPSPSSTPGRQRIGAVCDDGTLSDAIDSGACANHGGLRCPLYSDGTCSTSSRRSSHRR
jgi:hypothetical protein